MDFYRSSCIGLKHYLLTFLNCWRIKAAVTAIPTTSPVRPSHGVVCHRLSAHSPSPVPPSVGTNIRHVVSAMSPSNKMTVEVLVGGFSGVPLSGRVGAL